ncbi:MAG TPA: thermonuclease family protein [Acidimicrobiia bacterium]|nr:thermonuclease family protein [Acidimicrobiia bacterium]
MTCIGRWLLISLLIAGCRLAEESEAGVAGPDTPGTLPGEVTTGMVIRVNDGDSLVVETRSGEVEVRLMGINAPESYECYGQESERRLVELVEGEQVGLEEVGRDQFGRTLAYLWLGDRLVNLEQVAGGLAIATTPEVGDVRGETLLESEDQAYESGLGMWSDTVCGASGPPPSVDISGSVSSFDPPGPDDEVLGQEWVALSSEEGVDLSGWTIRDESSVHRCLLPGEFSIVSGAERIVASTDPCWDPGDSSVWNNGGDMALLLDTAGRVVARLRYPG